MIETSDSKLKSQDFFNEVAQSHNEKTQAAFEVYNGLTTFIRQAGLKSPEREIAAAHENSAQEMKTGYALHIGMAPKHHPAQMKNFITVCIQNEGRVLLVGHGKSECEILFAETPVSTVRNIVFALQRMDSELAVYFDTVIKDSADPKPKAA